MNWTGPEYFSPSFRAAVGSRSDTRFMQTIYSMFYSQLAREVVLLGVKGSGSLDPTTGCYSKRNEPIRPVILSKSVCNPKHSHKSWNSNQAVLLTTLTCLSIFYRLHCLDRAGKRNIARLTKRSDHVRLSFRMFRQLILYLDGRPDLWKMACEGRPSSLSTRCVTVGWYCCS